MLRTRRIDRAVAEVQRQLACGIRLGRMGQRLAAPIGHSSEAPLQRSVRMRQLGQPPKRCQPIVRPGDSVGSAARLEAGRDRAEIGPGVRGPRRKSARQSARQGRRPAGPSARTAPRAAASGASSGRAARERAGHEPSGMTQSGGPARPPAPSARPDRHGQVPPQPSASARACRRRSRSTSCRSRVRLPRSTEWASLPPREPPPLR